MDGAGAARRSRRRWPAAVAAGAILAAVLATPVAARSGCPAGSWDRMSVAGAAALIYPHLLVPPPGGLDAFAAMVGGEDRDGNTLVCVKETWGEDLNPRSHWARLGMELLGEPTHAFIVHDDTASATD
jgi:hypothetical protein